MDISNDMCKKMIRLAAILVLFLASGQVALAQAKVVGAVDGRYCWGSMSGTSMATPTVAGIIALWLEAKPDAGIRKRSMTIRTMSMALVRLMPIADCSTSWAFQPVFRN